MVWMANSVIAKKVTSRERRLTIDRNYPSVRPNESRFEHAVGPCRRRRWSGEARRFETTP
jgi:hypothetical protein